ncbi:hypothetical protein [Anaerorhabdus sp.]|nr:hypothetical protein [Anaerorhabdus sp.]MEA4875426.1 hypothetical protein [Anaerorhabdus sp.]
MKQQTKNFIRNLKNFEKNIVPLETYIEDEYMEGDKAVVYVNCLNEEDIFESYSYQSQKSLNPAIYDFIDSKVYPIPAAYPVEIRFVNKAFSKHEVEEIREIIKEHYSLILRDKLIDLRINMIKITALLIIGIVLLGIYFSLQLADMGSLFMEFLSIAGTFALWEAVDFYILERKQVENERFNAGQMALASIQFEDVLDD